jgi:hypothetical protein
MDSLDARVEQRREQRATDQPAAPQALDRTA